MLDKTQNLIQISEQNNDHLPEQREAENIELNNNNIIQNPSINQIPPDFSNMAHTMRDILERLRRLSENSNSAEIIGRIREGMNNQIQNIGDTLTNFEAGRLIANTVN